MSGAEVPKFNPDFNPVNAALPETSTRPYELDLNDRTQALKETLDFCRQPDAMNHTFTFFGTALEGVAIPSEVHKLIKKYGQIDSITVSTAYLHESSGTSYDIQFEFCDTELNITRLSVCRPYNYYEEETAEGEYDFVYNESMTEDNPANSYDSIKPISKKELNRCLASLIYNDGNISTAVLDAKDWYSGNYDELTQILQPAAITATDNQEYIFATSEGGPAGTFSVERANNEIVEMRYYRVDKQTIDAAPNGELGYYEKGVEVSMNGRDTTDIIFNSHFYLDGDYYTKTFTPTDNDYRLLFEFIDQQITQTHTAWANKSAGNAAHPVE